jgi:hypothetical protein
VGSEAGESDQEVQGGVVRNWREELGRPSQPRSVGRVRGRGDLIELLRTHGADALHVNNAGRTPVGLARLIANFTVAQFFTDLQA